MNYSFLEGRLRHHNRKILGSENFKNFAVLLPIIEKEGKIHILFEVRSFELKRQPGEICFPGGKVEEEDKTEQETAIRETIEELGIKREDITKVFPLDYIVNFGQIIYPFVGFLKPETTLQFNQAEVAEVFYVPLDYLLSVQPDVYKIRYQVQPEENFPFDKIINGEQYHWRLRQTEEYFYDYEDKTIWGLTAKILTHFLSLIKS